MYNDARIFGKEKLFNKFLKKESIEKKNIIYVGDEIRDILACQKVGIKIISVTWGFNTRLGLMKYNTNIVDSAVELLNMIADKSK